MGQIRDKAAEQQDTAQAECAPEQQPIKQRLTAEQKRKRKQRKRRRRMLRVFLWGLFAAAAAVLIFCIMAIIFTLVERKAARDQYALLQSTYEATPADADGGEEPQSEERIDETKWYAASAQLADKKIDFSALRQRNPDVCGWITVEGTTIDYPIFKATGTDVFYLSHDIDGSASEHGSVCLDVLSACDFSDRVTLMYGHNMKDGSMFAPLYRYYRDLEFFQAGHRIRIYLDNAVLTYRVVAAYEYGYEHPLYYYDMTDDEDFAAYCATFLKIRDMKAHVEQTEIGPDEHLLTLITSTNVRADRRLFVQAVLEHGEQTPAA